MPRGPGKDKTPPSTAVECRVDGGNACSGGKRGDLDRACADRSIGIQPAAALRRELPNARDIARVVDARQDVVGCGVERNLGTTGEKV